MAGFVAQNILDKRMDVIYAEEMLGGVDGATQMVVDVRTPEEYDAGYIEGSVLIPIDDLRARLGELDKAKEIIVYCQVGLRGYLASRILSAAGFRVRNLSGGYKTWSAFMARDYDSTYLAPVNTPSCSSPAGEAEGGKRVVVDASGMQCPGPIMQLKKAVQGLKEGELVEMRATDQGFALDVPAWCARTGNSLVEIGLSEGVYKALVRKGGGGDVCAVEKSSANKKTMVVFSNDLDKAMAAFIIANGAASMGSEVTLFFTFWGLNLLRRDAAVKVKKSFMESMFAAMMARGPKKTVLSKMHMGGMGTMMMRNVMKNKHVMSLEQLIESALASGVKLVACTMTMDIMGIKREELIEGVDFGGVAAYLDRADDASYNVFI
jgi:peroxiredoxin family protein/rhodanese-related sulfurtransferase/TusA-related sulfurtransferase